MPKRILNILTTVLLAVMWAAPLCALTPEQEDALYGQIDSLYEAAMQAYNGGLFDSSAEALKQAVDLQKQIAENDELLALYMTLATAQSGAGQYEEALTTTDNALALAATLPTEEAKIAQLKNNRTYLESKINMPVEERVEITKHTIVREASATMAQDLFTAATGAYHRGQCDSALMIAKQAIKADTLGLIYAEDRHTAFHNIAACRLEEARTLKRQGEYGDALKMLQQIQTQFGEDAPRTQIEAEMASCHSMSGNYEQAIRLYSNILLTEPENAAVLNNLSVCYARIGDYARSLALQEKVLRAQPDNTKVMANIATTYFRQGNYAQALKMSERAAARVRERDGEQSEAYAAALVNEAACYAVMNRTDEALQANEQALAIQRAVLGNNHIALATTLNNIADCHYRRLDFEEALNSLQQAAQIRKSVLGEKHPDYILTINNIATCYAAMGDRAHYVATKQQCLNWMLRDVKANFTWLTEQQRQMYVQQRASLLEGIIASGCPEDMQYDKQLLTKGLLLSSAVELERIMHEAKDPQIQQCFADLRSIRLALDELYAQPAGEQDRPQIEELNRQAEALEQNLLSRSQAYGDLTRSMTYHWRDVQKQLGEHDIAVEFAKEGKGADARYVALVLRKGWPMPKGVLIGKQQDFQEYIDKRYRAYEYEELGNAIWHNVLLTANATEGERIYFSPDGFMYQMGIEYLTADGHLMNDTYKMYRLSSTRLLCQPKSKPQGSDITLFGGLLYGLNNTKGEMFQYLPATLREVQDIAALYPNAQTYIGEQGTEEAFYALSGHSPRHLHIATHGFYIQGERAQELVQSQSRSAGFIQIGANSEVADNSLSRTGLLMCGAENAWTGKAVGQHADGVLTAREIMLSDLHTTEIAVLSACQTGMGDIEADGVAGLQRGLKKAGVQTMMMSLWDVNDEATRILMTTFYSGLLAGKTKQQALRDAQQQVRTFTGKTAQAQRAIVEEEAYMAEMESLDRSARPLKFLRQNGGQNSTNVTQDNTPKMPYAAPRYWAAFILLDALE